MRSLYLAAVLSLAALPVWADEAQIVRDQDVKVWPLKVWPLRVTMNSIDRPASFEFHMESGACLVGPLEFKQNGGKLDGQPSVIYELGAGERYPEGCK